MSQAGIAGAGDAVTMSAVTGSRTDHTTESTPGEYGTENAPVWIPNANDVGAADVDETFTALMVTE